MSGRLAQSVKREDLSSERLGELGDKRLVARGIAEPANHCGDLRVKERLRDGAGEIEEDLDVLARGVEHLEDALIRHQSEQRRQIDPRSEHVDGRGTFGTGHLHKAQDRPIGALAHELGVDRNKARALLLGAKAGQRGGVGDDRHCYAIY